jgi:hypothetical protein
MLDQDGESTGVRRPFVGEKLAVRMHSGGVTVYNKEDGPIVGLVYLRECDVLALELPAGYYEGLRLSTIEEAVYQGMNTTHSPALQHEFRLKFTNHPQLNWRCLCEFQNATITLAQLAENSLYDQAERAGKVSLVPH